MAEATDHLGTITTFDDPVGIGTVITDDGTEHGFHCTAIADGSRKVDVGARVRFTVVPGRQGRWEAADLRPESPTA